MNVEEKTREQLVEENADLRRRLAVLEAQSAQSQQAEADQRRINDRLPVLVATAGFDGYYKEVNSAFERVLGWSEQESRSRPFIEFIHPEDHAAAVETFARLTSGEPVLRFLDRNICKDGTCRWIDWTVIPVPERSIVFGIGQDVTKRKQAEDDRKRAEEALVEREARLLEAQEVASLGFYVLDIVAGRWTSSSVLDRIFGLAVDYARTTEGWADLVHPDDRQAMMDYFFKDVVRNTRLFDREYRIVRNNDGQVRWVHGLGRLELDVDGRPVSMLGTIQDITERKRAQFTLQEARDELERRVEVRTVELRQTNQVLELEVQQRRQAEEKLEIFKRFVEAATQGFGMADVDGRITYANPYMARLFGSRSPDEVIGTHVSKYYPADYPLRREREIIPALQRGEHWQGELVLVFSDGQMHPTIQTIFPVHDEQGQLFRTAAVVTDITELKRAEEELRQSYEELRESEERYDLAARGAGVGLWDWNLCTGRVYYSPRWKALFGYDDDEIGEGFEDWASRLHPDEREQIVKLQDDFLAGNSLTVSAEYRLRHKDGSYRWVGAHALAVRDAAGKAIRLVGSHADVTDRKLAEDEVRQSHDQLQAIYEGMIEGLLITDIATKRFVRVNGSICRMLGYSEEELLTKAIKDIHPTEEVPNDERRFEAAAEGRVSINENRPVLRKDGSIFYADITGHRIFYDKRPCLLALFRDVTERRQAEQKLKREQKALRRMMLASDHERHLITYELHDGVTQQLLGARMLLASQMPSKHRKSKDADAYRTGMDALIQAIAEVRRVMNWLRTPVLDRFGLAEAIEDVAAQLRSTPNAPEIECRCAVKFKRLEPSLENSLFRIAQEAMTNACRHSRSEKVRVRLTQKGDDVMLEVRDWGIGFDLKAVPEDRFGLEGIRERCRVLGGKLSIKGQPGKGTVVQVKFPLVEAVANG
ncbi:MAG: PAS domain S-box protein [Pirellulaceae bacterium]|nr:PAS domain S-box protein [Pirellulaceae bacterium]